MVLSIKENNTKNSNNKCFIIAEAGVNHNGNINLALKMVDAAAECGADAIKFQTFSADRLVSLDAQTASYQKTNSGYDNQYEMLKNLEISEEDHRTLFKRCQEKKIEFMSTPFDEEGLDFLISLGMKRIKVASGELTNIPFLRKIASKNLPTIISTGMANLEEIAEAIDIFRTHRALYNFVESLSDTLTILHCTSNYPCPLEQANLQAIQTIYEAFSLPVGYSDHTLSTQIASICIGLGAKVYEKHFTLDTNLSGPDHAASLTIADLKTLINNIRFAEKCLGSGEKLPTPEELEIKKMVRKSLVMKVDKAQGETISEADLSLLRPGEGLAPKYYDKLIGKKLKNSVSRGHVLVWDDIIL